MKNSGRDALLESYNVLNDLKQYLSRVRRKTTPQMSGELAEIERKLENVANDIALIDWQSKHDCSELNSKARSFQCV